MKAQCAYEIVLYALHLCICRLGSTYAQFFVDLTGVGINDWNVEVSGYIEA